LPPLLFQADLEDHSNELKMAEDNAKKAMEDAAMRPLATGTVATH